MHQSAFRLSAALILADQLTKGLAVRFLEPVGTVPLLPFLSLTYVENTGISFGMLRHMDNRFLLALNTALIAAILWHFIRRMQTMNTRLRMAFLLILSGAVGNLADRILRGFVVDFLDFHVWPVFNAADSMITIGAGLYLLDALRHAKKRQA